MLAFPSRLWHSPLIESASSGRSLGRMSQPREKRFPIRAIRRAVLRVAGSRFMRNQVARLAAACGVAVLRSDRLPVCTANLLALACEGLLRDQPHPRFVQIGANDGVTSAPLHDLIIRHGMTGVLVEPLPDVFERLIANYRSVPGLAFENAAVANNDGETVLFVPKSRDAAPVTTLASLDSHHPAFGSLDRSEITSIRVRTMTMATLFRKHGFESLDILQVDAEGFDLQVVKAALSTGVRPRIIHFENHHLSPVEKAESRSMMNAFDYRYVENFSDTLAVRVEER